ncbi:MAG TPA: DUF2442 domain-containing protein, partial [Candidatus Wallbacteria bacterium]|nr:DUF2442 domain-containing protein [Candidatus Wallbacteria bacterium]
VKNVIALDNMLLQVEFENGVKKTYDTKPLKKRWTAFEELENRSLFNLVKVDAGGYGVTWSSQTDLACNELWENGKPVQ